MLAETENRAISFYPYQQKWLNDDSRLKIGMFSRQTGKTFTNSAEIVIDCLHAEQNGTKTRWIILSRGERQAKEMMEVGIKPMLKAYFNAVANFVEEDINIEGANYRALEAELPGGSRITALPANPDTARGFSANLFLDEFAFHQNSRAIWQAVFPVISANNFKVRVSSTPNGKSNKFYDLMTGADDLWSRHIVNIYDAVKQGLPRDIEFLRAGCADNDLWAQEFELEWLEENEAWLTFDLINSCHDASINIKKPPLPTPRGQYYLGVDIARRNDLWVAVVLEKIGDVLWTREIITKKNVTFAEHDAIIDDLIYKYNPVRVAGDGTGMGEKVLEDWQNKYGSVIDNVNFSKGGVRLNLANAIKAMMQDRKLRLPIDDVLRRDLHSIKSEKSETGNMRLKANRDSDGHADRFWAMALAVAGAIDGGFFAPEEVQSLRGTLSNLASNFGTNAKAIYQHTQRFI